MEHWPQYTFEKLGNLTQTQLCVLLDVESDTITFRTTDEYNHWRNNNGR